MKSSDILPWQVAQGVSTSKPSASAIAKVLALSAICKSQFACFITPAPQQEAPFRGINSISKTLANASIAS